MERLFGIIFSLFVLVALVIPIGGGALGYLGSSIFGEETGGIFALIGMIIMAIWLFGR